MESPPPKLEVLRINHNFHKTITSITNITSTAATTSYQSIHNSNFKKMQGSVSIMRKAGTLDPTLVPCSFK